MRYAIGDVVWLRRDTRLVELRGRVGTNLGKVGDVWADADGEHISVIYEDEQVLALDLAASEFMVERFVRRGSVVMARRTQRSDTIREAAALLSELRPARAAICRACAAVHPTGDTYRTLDAVLAAMDALAAQLGRPDHFLDELHRTP